ncbi:MAG: hypothetical protein LBR38_04805 [Synergistaceae bacterium]|jgi:hypothetical protein|nr:hypothetical protein [Synergistaceae bacterium]
MEVNFIQALAALGGITGLQLAALVILGLILLRRIDSVRNELKTDITSVEHKVDLVRAELKADIADVRSELKTDIAGVRTDMDMLRTNDLEHLKNFDKAIVFLLSKDKNLDAKDVAYVKSLTE